MYDVKTILVLVLIFDLRDFIYFQIESLESWSQDVPICPIQSCCSIFVWGGMPGSAGSGHGSRGDGSYVTGQTSGRPVSNQSFTNTQQITSPT